MMHSYFIPVVYIIIICGFFCTLYLKGRIFNWTQVYMYTVGMVWDAGNQAKWNVWIRVGNGD